MRGRRDVSALNTLPAWARAADFLFLALIAVAAAVAASGGSRVNFGDWRVSLTSSLRQLLGRVVPRLHVARRRDATRISQCVDCIIRRAPGAQRCTVLHVAAVVLSAIPGPMKSGIGEKCKPSSLKVHLRGEQKSLQAVPFSRRTTFRPADEWWVCGTTLARVLSFPTARSLL